MNSDYVCERTGLCIWRGSGTETVTNGSVIYFSSDHFDPHTAVVFETMGLAEGLHGILMANPHSVLSGFTPVLEIFETDKKIYVIAFAREGTSLQDVVFQNAKDHFYDRLWPTDRYKNLLMDLITVIRDFAGTGVEVSLHPQNIFVLNDRATITGLSFRNPTDVVTLGHGYEKVVDIMDFIDLHFGTKKHLEYLSETLKMGNRRNLNGICYMPFFWSNLERIEFIKDLWEWIKKKKGSIAICNITDGSSPFKAKKLDDVRVDGDLAQWHALMNKKAKTWSTISITSLKANTSCKEFESNEKEARMCLNFIRKCLSHFIERKDQFHPPLTIVDEGAMVDRFDDVFPGFLWNLYEVARKHESFNKFLPIQESLQNLWFELQPPPR